MKLFIGVLAGCVIASSALAEEPVGCDKFKWSIEQERNLLINKAPNVSSGSSVASAFPVAVTVALVPYADAKLPSAPERAPRLPASNAGFVQVGAPARDGTYKISLSTDAWVDVVQAGHLVKSLTHSGATGCEGIRKSVKFELKAEPFAVQLSNAPGNSVGLAISGD